MELILQKYNYLHHKKNSIKVNLLELKDIMLNYLKLIYTLFLYVLKRSVLRIILWLKKILPNKLKLKLKQLLFYNNNVWKLLIFMEEWVKSIPSINERSQINKFVFYFIYTFFMPLFNLITKKEKWKCLMLEKLKNNPDLKNRLEQFIIVTENSKSESSSITSIIENLTISELKIYQHLNQVLIAKRIDQI